MEHERALPLERPERALPLAQHIYTQDLSQFLCADEISYMNHLNDFELKADLVGDDIHRELASKIKRIPGRILLRYMTTKLAGEPDLRHFSTMLDEVFAPYVEDPPHTDINQRIDAHKRELSDLFFILLDCVDLRLIMSMPPPAGGSRKNVKRWKSTKKSATQRKRTIRRRR